MTYFSEEPLENLEDLKATTSEQQYSHKNSAGVKLPDSATNQRYPSLNDYIAKQFETLLPTTEQQARQSGEQTSASDPLKKTRKPFKKPESNMPSSSSASGTSEGIKIISSNPDNPFDKTPGIPPKKLDGVYLDCLDVDLPAGLEQFLPTAAFRFRIKKKRLEQEIKTLKQMLSACQALSSENILMEGRIKRMLEHLAVLELKNQSIANELSNSLPMGGVTQKLLSWFSVSPVKQAADFSLYKTLWNQGIETIQRWIYGSAYKTVCNTKNRLCLLKETYSDFDRQKTLQPEEVSRMINRYDSLVAELKHSEKQLKKGFWERRTW